MLTVVLLNVQVFRDVMLCGWVSGLYVLHLNVHAVQEECCWTLKMKTL